MIITNLKEKIKSNPVIGTKPYLLIKVLYYLYMLTTTFSSEIFVGQAWNRAQNWFEFDIIGSYYLVFTINLLLGLFILFLGHYYFKCKISKPVLIIELVCLLGILVASLSFPTNFEYVDEYYKQSFGSDAIFKYHLSMEDRIHFLLSSILLLLFLYDTIVIIPKTYKYKRTQFVFYYFILSLCFIAIICSLILESNVYKDIFKLNLSYWKLNGLASFLGTKNVFGTLLFFGIISSLLLENYTKNFVYFIFALILYVFTIFSFCKTSVAVGIFLILSYVLFAILSNLKNKKRRNVFLVILLLMITAFLVILLSKNNPISNLFRINIKELFTRIKDDDSGTFYNRILMQERIFSLLLSNPTFFIFGIGNYQFYHAAFFTADILVVDIWHPHNAIFMALGEGGIIRLAAYILLTLYLIKILIKSIFKSKNKDAILFLLLLIAFEIRSISEPDYFLSSTWVSIVFSFLILIPILSLENKSSDETTFLVKNKNVNYMYYLSLLGSSLIGLGFVSGKIWFNVPLIIIGVILLSISININKDSENKHNNSIFNCILISVLVLTGLIIKINGKANLATTIEFGLYSLVVSFITFYFALHFGLLKLSFNSLTKYELQNNITQNNIKGNLINEK